MLSQPLVEFAKMIRFDFWVDPYEDFGDPFGDPAQNEPPALRKSDASVQRALAVINSADADELASLDVVAFSALRDFRRDRRHLALERRQGQAASDAVELQNRTDHAIATLDHLLACIRRRRLYAAA
ncbi:MAG TPA: hypothetical protein VHD87_15455 [Acidimicrobiales bacterium]|nr:hypothetical protein [Acidimicrobiales bacterium]